MTFIKFLILALSSLAAATSKRSQDTSKLRSALKSILPSSSQLTPQVLSTFLQPLEANIARSSPITRDGTQLKLLGQPWHANGANVYWLGIDENVIPPAGEPFYAPLNASYPTKGRITEAMATLVTLGAHLIRSQTLGISVGNPLSLEPDLGVWNEQAFDTIDWAVWQARQHGLRILPPLTDNYDYFHGGKFTFLRWAGYNLTGSQSPLPQTVQAFYTDPKVISIFKTYITKLLTHTNPYTGLSYASDPTIIGYETGNELSGPVFGDKNVPVAWTREICQLIKSLGPDKLCLDGTYGVNSTHFEVQEVDIFSDHFYPLNNTKLEAGIEQVEKADRVYFAGEIDWTDKNGGDTLQSFYDIIAARQKLPEPVVSGSMFWDLFGRDVPDCSIYVNHSDAFTLQYNNPANSPATTASIITIRKHYFAMENVTVDDYLPSVACPHNFIPGYEAEYTYF